MRDLLSGPCRAGNGEIDLAPQVGNANLERPLMKSQFRFAFLTGRPRFSSFFAGIFALGTAVCGIAPAAEVVINEVMFYPPVTVGGIKEEPAHQFVELHNSSSTAIELGGWILRGGVEFTFPPYSLAPNAFVVVAADRTALLALHPGIASKTLGDFVGNLGNSGERIVLENSLGAIVDEIEYADEGDWARRIRGPLDRGHQGWEWSSVADGGGYSLELTSPGLDNSFGGAWSVSATIGGSPGTANGALVTGAPPLLEKLTHHPALPRSSEPVRVSVKASPGTGAGLNVQLHYRSGSGAFALLIMVDDGTLGDLEAGDGTFSAEVPPYADGTVIEYYAIVCDDEGLLRRHPALPISSVSGEQTNYLYQVNDSFDRDHPANPDQPNLLVVLSETELSELDDLYVNAIKSNAKMNAAVVSWIGGKMQSRQNVGARNRGNSSRGDTPHSLRLTFRSDQSWEGRSALDINGRGGYKRIVGSAIFQRAGIEVASAVAGQLRMNGQDRSIPDSPSFGFYSFTESFGDEWARNHFPGDPDGNLYKVIVQGLSNNTTDARLRNRYSKETNKGQNDWSDLRNMLQAIYDSSDEEYYDAIFQHIDIDQWLRFLAVSALINNRETNISTGDADDFALYRGEIDPRFRLVPHDLDSVMRDGVSLSIMAPAGNAGLARFMAHPKIVPKYFAYIREYAGTVFSDAEMTPFIQELLGGLVSQTLIDGLLVSNAARRDFLLASIPGTFGASSALPVVNGLPETTESTTEIAGTADAGASFGVLVGGEPADYDPVTGQWTIPDAALFPGENNVLVQALGEDGQEVDRLRILIRYNNGVMNPVGPMSGFTTTTLTAEGGPWLLGPGTTFMGKDATLVIEPGATVYFPPDSLLRVRDRSTITAIGTDLHRIQFTRVPSDGPEKYRYIWIHSGGTPNNTLSHLDMRYAGAVDNRQMWITTSRVLLDNVTWSESTSKVLRLVDPYLEVRNCTFPAVTGECITGTGFAAGGYFILDGNVFGFAANDVIDFTGGKRPGPILQVTNNLFLGSSNEHLDLDGTDAHIEGNVFKNIHKVDAGPSSANSISTGIHDGIPSAVTVVRNVFYDVDHALLLKQGSTGVFENNTVVGATIAAINFGEPERPGGALGDGAVVRGNIFKDCAATFQNVDASVVLEADLNLMPAADHLFGTGNVDFDPLFVDQAGEDYRLKAGSPARGIGPNGIDMGAHVARWESVRGVPAPPATTLESALLTVDGPGVGTYRYSLDGGDFGLETDITTPISLSGLAPGDHQVALIGKNSAGVWQEEGEATLSALWNVDPAAQGLRINELLADNVSAHGLSDGSHPDVIELYNASGVGIDLSGYQLTDDPLVPDKYIIPAGIMLPDGSYLVLYGGTGVEPDALYTGFLLRSGGEQVELRDAIGTLIDSVAFGTQAADFSIGEMGESGEWGLCIPTPGAANQRSPLGDSASLVLNEWLSSPEVFLGGDFIEIYNRGVYPVELSGLALSDRPFSEPMKQLIPALSYVGPSGFSTFYGEQSGRPDGLEFGLSAFQGWVGLIGPDGAVIDQAPYDSQSGDGSRGRIPDGSSTFGELPIPTPDLSNITPPAELTQAVNLLEGLRITEVQYNPAGGSDAEYLELRNVGPEILDLEGVSIDGAVEYTFGALTLSPGERIIVAADLAVFDATYGASRPVVGPFSGKLSNGGEEIVVSMPPPHAIAIQRFEYNNSWYQPTDGGGFSLTIVDPLAPGASWSDAASWQVSEQIGGSPGDSATHASLTGGAYLSEPGDLLLTGGLADEGLEISSAGLTFSWNQSQSPPVVFSPANTAASMVSFPEPGEYRLSLEIRSGGDVWTAEHIVLVGDNFEAWLSRHFSPAELANPFVSGPDADPDGDERSNLEEYAYATNPRLADIAPEQKVTVVEGSPLFEFPRPFWITDVSYVIEYSTDLLFWNDDPLLHHIVDRIETVGGIYIVAARTIDPGATGFYRMRLELTD